jgi:hypothetical protein
MCESRSRSVDGRLTAPPALSPTKAATTVARAETFTTEVLRVHGFSTTRLHLLLSVQNKEKRQEKLENAVSSGCDQNRTDQSKANVNESFGHGDFHTSPSYLGR